MSFMLVCIFLLLIMCSFLLIVSGLLCLIWLIVHIPLLIVHILCIHLCLLCIYFAYYAYTFLLSMHMVFMPVFSIASSSSDHSAGWLWHGLSSWLGPSCHQHCISHHQLCIEGITPLKAFQCWWGWQI